VCVCECVRACILFVPELVYLFKCLTCAWWQVKKEATKDLSKPGPRIKHKMVRGHVSVKLDGYVEASDVLRMEEQPSVRSSARVQRKSARNGRSGAGSAGRGGQEGDAESRAASCNPRPSNLFRAPAADRGGELGALREVLDADLRDLSSSRQGLGVTGARRGRSPRMLNSPSSGLVDTFVTRVSSLTEGDSLVQVCRLPIVSVATVQGCVCV